MPDAVVSSVLTAHRALYDAVEAGDADLMTALWSDDPETSCVHPGAPILHGTSEIVRSWLVLMAQIGYIQLPQIQAVKQDLPFIGCEKAHYQTPQGTFP